MRRAGRAIDDATITKGGAHFAGYRKNKGPLHNRSGADVIKARANSSWSFRILSSTSGLNWSNSGATENDSLLNALGLISSDIWLSRCIPVVVVPLTITATKPGLASRSTPANAV